MYLLDVNVISHDLLTEDLTIFPPKNRPLHASFTNCPLKYTSGPSGMVHTLRARDTLLANGDEQYLELLHGCDNTVAR